MNFPTAMISAGPPRPALELIALAQLSPDRARQRLRALLLTNPDYFAKIPPASLSTVLNIQEDTSYEEIGGVDYDPELHQLTAVINLKQSTGYSSEILPHGSREFLRFYESQDGGSRWQDLGMRSATVADAHRSRPLNCGVALPHTAGKVPVRIRIRPKIRAILSWSAPPPAGQPGWKPLWGNVAEFEVHLDKNS